jgi:hypothetical protein
MQRRSGVQPPSGLAPLGRHRLDFSLLHEDEFELLCFHAIAIDFREAVHVANPDGGADTALPRTDRSWERCWQSKRFTRHIKWPQCVESLDAAVENFGMEHYTFCFARDLTHPQEALFAKHLIGRHDGVIVDYWGPTRLEGLLFGSEQGKRLAAEFWGDRERDTRAFGRAIRAGGDLSTGAGVLDRLAAIAEHLRDRDPFLGAPDVSVGAYPRSGSAGRRPPTVSIANAISAWAEWKP